MTIQRGIDPAIRAAGVRRLRSGAIAGGDGIDRHEDLHRAAEPGQSVRVRTAGGRLAHRPIVTKVMHQDAIDLPVIAAIYASLEKRRDDVA